jgi:Glycosyl transferase family 11
MITFRRLGHHGRLGNQLYQYALLKGVEARRGFEVRIPKPYINRTEKPLPCGANALAAFRLDCGELTVADEGATPHVYDETTPVFHPDVFDVEDGTNFDGYFQSWRYFEHIEERLRVEFRFREDIEKQARQALDSRGAGGRIVVGINVRRGDYTLPSFAELHVLPCPSYYLRAAATFPCGSLFVVVSDDIEWCRRNLPVDDFVFFDSGNYWIDMAALTFCDHNIISASTFSWWAACLNSAPGKRVICPSVWFREPVWIDYSLDDRYPPSWERLDPGPQAFA